MSKLGIDPDKYDKYKSYDEHMERFSFVLINPSHDYILRPGDIVYLLKPGASLTSNNTVSMDSGTGAGGGGMDATGTTGQETGNTSGGHETISKDNTSETSTPIIKTTTSSAVAAAVSHMSIDESWLEDAVGSAKNSTSLFASKLNLGSLKKLFFGNNQQQQQHDRQQHYKHAPVSMDDDESTRLAEMNQERVRSKSMAVTSQYKRGKVTKQAMRKMFYNRNKLNMRENGLNNTNI